MGIIGVIVGAIIAVVIAIFQAFLNVANKRSGKWCYIPSAP